MYFFLSFINKEAELQKDWTLYQLSSVDVNHCFIKALKRTTLCIFFIKLSFSFDSFKLYVINKNTCFWNPLFDWNKAVGGSRLDRAGTSPEKGGLSAWCRCRVWGLCEPSHSLPFSRGFHSPHPHPPVLPPELIFATSFLRVTMTTNELKSRLSEEKPYRNAVSPSPSATGCLWIRLTTPLVLVRLSYRKSCAAALREHIWFQT